MLFPTTIVGSYPQPEWLIDRAKLAGRFPPRVRAKELWRVEEPYLKEAMEDATLLAIRAQEDAGLDIITDGEIRRESYSNRIATALEGIDIDNPGVGLDRSGHPNPVPRIVGKIKRLRPIELEDLLFLKANTQRKVKITVPGPFTMLQQAQNDFYATEEEAAMDYAAALNEALNRALLGVTGTTAVHICFGYAAVIHVRPEGYSFLPELSACSCTQISIETAQSNLDCQVLEQLGNKKIMLGCIDLSDMNIESPVLIASRVKKALKYVAAENIILAPDCGMKYLPREVANGKLKAMVQAAQMLRSEVN